jgi:subtilase family serine protease
VSVGGVNAPIDQSGQLIGPLTAWGTQTGGAISGQGSGGGCSDYFPLPTFQTGIPGETCSKRSQPDVSLDADTNTGVSVDINAPPNLGGRELAVIGGTSVAAPDMAAMWALVLQACKQNSNCMTSGAASAHPYRLGTPNPLFYEIYTKGLHGVGYANVFSDVQYGGNSTYPTPVSSSSPAPSPSPTAPGYTAGAGYDLTTGIGVPFARSLIRAVVGV